MVVEMLRCSWFGGEAVVVVKSHRAMFGDVQRREGEET